MNHVIKILSRDNIVVFRNIQHKNKNKVEFHKIIKGNLKKKTGYLMYLPIIN